MILDVFSNLDNSVILSRGNSELSPLPAYQHFAERSDVQNHTLKKQNGLCRTTHTAFTTSKPPSILTDPTAPQVMQLQNKPMPQVNTEQPSATRPASRPLALLYRGFQRGKKNKNKRICSYTLPSKFTHRLLLLSHLCTGSTWSQNTLNTSTSC